MALSIISSNRVEILQSRLAQHLAAAPLTDPFVTETIVVPTFAMARWLNLQIAQQQGVAANIEYPQVGEWVWHMAAAVLTDLPSLDPYTRDALAWQIYSQLPELLERRAFASLEQYLADDRVGIKRWQLAQRIAGSFDRYQSYRPQTIREWSRGEDNQWQAQLWRSLIENRGLDHRVASITRLIEVLEQGPAPNILPQRVSLFALSSLPPLYLEVLRALAPRIELNLYLHSPSDQYWADLESEKQKSRRQLAAPRQQDLFDAGNELLASWGRQGQVFQDLLLNQVSAESIDIDLFARPGDDSLLNQIQRSIFTLESSPQPVEPDDSVSIHVCHSAMRECQVLQDHILSMLQQDPQLNPEEILVMVPDIAAYAPYIEAVFQHERIACNISDVSLADEHPLVMAFLQLLKLPQSRFTSSEVLGLLDNQSIRQRFELDEQGLTEIRRLVDQGYTRWGIDAGHKAEFDLPPTAGNTWQQSRERFFAGYALADDTLWRGIAPLPACDDSDAITIGRFWHFFERLRSWRERLGRNRDATEWQVLLAQLLDDFFVETDVRESRLQQIRNAINQIQLAGQSEISPGLMHYLMSQWLQKNEQSGQLYSGGITFCGMRPMRSIPFKVICLLGLNRNDFPRREPHSDFEIMAVERKRGDPSNRDEDRYLMLETLLCARQRLYLSYTGRNLRDNSPLQPSVLVQELTDFIDTRFGKTGDDRPLSASLTRVYPMQVFSPDNFRAPSTSYRRYWCDVAGQMSPSRKTTDKSRSTQPLAPTRVMDGIDLERLRRFIANPIRYFFHQRLSIYLDRDEIPDDDETFDLSQLEQWRLRQYLAAATLSGREDDSSRLLAEGWLAHGHAAEAQVAKIRQDEAEWFDAIAQYRDIPSIRLSVEIDLEDNGRLAGSVANYFPGKGLMTYHGGSFSGRQLLVLWINHLALCAAGLWRPQETSLLLCRNQSWRLPQLDTATAQVQLADYCQLYKEGMAQPLPVFPDASYTWASEPDRSKALARTMRLWQNPWNTGGDSNSPYIELSLRDDFDLPIGSAEFDRYARRLYARLLESAETV